MRISILGVGSMGSVVATALASTGHEIHLHVRGERGANLMLNGIECIGQSCTSVTADRFIFSCEEFEPPQAIKENSDIVIICTKAQSVHSLLEMSQFVLKPDGIAFCLANGLGHMEALRQRLGLHRVLAATTTHGAFTDTDGCVHWVGEGNINLAIPPLGPNAQGLEEVVDCLQEGHLNPKIQTDALSMIWEKVLLNIAINPIAALGGLKNGELLAPELFSMCMMVYREAAQVGRLERIEVPGEQEFEHRLRLVLESTKENSCSMLEDVKHGRSTEIGFLNLAIVTLAEEHGLEVPLNQLLSTLIEACHP